MKADIFAEIFLWNKNVEHLICVLQRMEVLDIWSRQEMTHYEVRLEELRANLNADFAERTASGERFHQHRFESVRLAAELKNSFADHAAKQTKQTKQTNQRNH